LLDNAKDPHWTFHLRGDLERLEEGDLSAVEHLLSAYGGMGSLNDLYICAENEHAISIADRESVNTRLRNLTSEMWRLAKSITK
jgi:hypothetical protein